MRISCGVVFSLLPADPDLLLDGFILLMEGSYGGGQVFWASGPAAQVGKLTRFLLGSSFVGRPYLCSDKGLSVPVAHGVQSLV